MAENLRAQPHLWLLIGGCVIAFGYAIAAVRVDLASRRIPNRLVARTAATAWGTYVLLLISGAPQATLLRGLQAVGVIAGPLLLIWLIRPSALGPGDVKLAAALAPLTAWPATTNPLIALAAMFVFAVPQATKTKALAFGPYIVAGIATGTAINIVFATPIP